MATITAERVVELNALGNGHRPLWEECPQDPKKVFPLDIPIEFRTRQQVGSFGDVVSIKERLRGGQILGREYWFSLPSSGVSMRDAHPSLAALFKNRVHFLSVVGWNKEPQLYLETDGIDQPFIPKSHFWDGDDGQYKERYY